MSYHGGGEMTVPAHQLSPSSWNNFESCPRKYWLSRQRLPRKAGMAATIGTAVHDSVEDMCNLDISSRDADEVGWLPPTAKAILDLHWQKEKDIFMSTPRHPAFKDGEIIRAHDLLIGSLNLLISNAKIGKVRMSEVTIAQWRMVQDTVLAAEGTLRSSCGRLMGRLDLLVKELDEDRNPVGWIVADLKTGKMPTGGLYDTVSRQLRFYRDMLMENNPKAPRVRAQGWYSAGPKVYEAEGPSVLDDAFRAWEGMAITKEPLEANPDEEACRFCEWKAWCPSWFYSRTNGTLPTSEGLFRDEVAIVLQFDSDSGACMVELLTSKDEEGGIIPSGRTVGIICKGQSLEQMRSVVESDHRGAVFLGSIRSNSRPWAMGDWSEVLPWTPLLESVRN